MTGKIILIIFMALGAFLVYGASWLSTKIKLSEDNEKDIIKFKISGFIIIVISAVVAFTRF